MDRQRRKELMEEFKQIKTHMGIIQIKNKVSGKIFIAAYPNLKNKWMSIRGQLDFGRFINSGLQKDWNELGAENFSYTVLEEKEVKEDTDRLWELGQMEKAWLEKLQPYGDNGYNKPAK